MQRHPGYIYCVRTFCIVENLAEICTAFCDMYSDCVLLYIAIKSAMLQQYCVGDASTELADMFACIANSKQIEDKAKTRTLTP